LMRNATFPPIRPMPWNHLIHSSFYRWNREQVLSLLLSLRAVAPLVYKSMRLRLIATQMTAEATMIQPSPKMIYAYRLIQRLAPNDKMIIFSTYKVFLEHVMAPWLEQIGIQSLLFCGGARTKQQRVLSEFRKESSIKVLLIVKSAGSEGLNMQFDANTCLLMDPHWNLALDEQAAQRIDRIGQTKEVIVRKMYMEGSIDEAMRIMQQEKQLGIDAWHGEGTRSMQTHGLFLSKRDTVQ
jgi:SNF2 family DNA or RNA helicase